MDADLRELAERVHLLSELKQTIGWQVLTDEAEREAEKKRRRVLGGRCTHEEYLRDASFLEGLGYVVGLPDALAERYVSRRREV